MVDKPDERSKTKPIALRWWEELYERQRAYLEAVYRADQNEEEWQRTAWHRGWERRSAEERRWLPYHSEFSPIRLKLEALGLVDK